MTLIALEGQSNALGYKNDGPAPYTPNDFVYIRVGDHWEAMRPGVNTGTAANPTAWGPEVGIANDFLRDHPGEVLAIVKTVKGSTGLAADPHELDWSPQSRGEMYDQATAEIRAAAKSISAAGPDVVYLMQGEQDATDAIKAAHYGANLVDLFAHMRADWGASEIVFGRVADSTPHWEAVRWAQYLVDIADPHAHSFDTFDFTRQPDGLHYDAAGQMRLGHDFYEGWAL